VGVLEQDRPPTSLDPESPRKMLFIESFNGAVSRELFGPSYFETVEQARRAARVWRTEYDDFQPHSMLAKSRKSLWRFQYQSRSRLSNGRTVLLIGERQIESYSKLPSAWQMASDP
jgi:hypothetical protein